MKLVNTSLAVLLRATIALAVLLLPLPEAAWAQLPLPQPALTLDVGGGATVLVRQADGKVIAGGSFTKVNGAAQANLARFNADGTLDATFHPALDGPVTAVVVSGSAIYVAGQFSHIDGVTRARLAKLSLLDGNADAAFNPAPDADVTALAADVDGRIYAAGAFTSIGGVAGRNLVKLDGITGAAEGTWNPVFPGTLTGIGSLGANGPFLYVVGYLGNQSAVDGRAYRVFRATGAHDATWAPPAANVANAGSSSIAFDASGNAFVAGPGGFIFGSGGSQIAQVTVAKFLVSNGAVDPAWVVPSDGSPFLLVDGASVYTSVGGSRFEELASRTIAKRNAITGAIVSGWSSPDLALGYPYAAVAAPEGVWVAGIFSYVGAARAPGVARLDPGTGTLQGNFPSRVTSPGYGMSVAALPDGKFLAGGNFDYVNDVPRSNLARLNADGTLDTTWTTETNGYVWRVTVHAAYAYAGGGFTAAGGAARHGAARIDFTSGAVDPVWNPDADGSVRRFAFDGTDVYMSGTFTTVGGAQRPALAKVSGSDGTLVSAFFPGFVEDCFAGTGGLAYADGFVYTGSARFCLQVPGQSLGLARLSSTTGTHDSSWNPDVNVRVREILIAGADMYVTGQFTTVAGTAKRGLAKIAVATGALDTAWGDAPSAQGLVYTAAIVGPYIYTGGYTDDPETFEVNPAVDRHALTTGLRDTAWNPTLAPIVPNNGLGINGIAGSLSGDRVFIAGNFAAVSGQESEGFAAFSNASFTVTNTNDSGAGSLRDAIAQANLRAGEKEIILDVTGTITLTSGQLQITSGPLTIMGPGAGDLAIDGNANGRIFLIMEANAPACPALSGPSDFLVSISGLTLQNARRSTDSSGGAIQTFKSITLDSVVIKNNVAPRGGGLSFLGQHAGQSLTITNSAFLDNVVTPTAAGIASNVAGGAVRIGENCTTTRTATTTTISNSLFRGNRSQPTTTNGTGAAIAMFSFGSVTISDSRLIDNHVEPPAPPVSNFSYGGGAIYGTAKSLTIERTEIAENSGNIGGGVFLYNDVPDLQTPATVMAFKLVNSTVSDNTAITNAGAINLFGNVAAEIYNSTLAGNLGQTQLTGGIRVQTGATSPASSSNATPPTLALVSSILSNTANATADIGIASPNVPTPYVIESTNSLVQSPGIGAVVEGSGNLIGFDPYLGPLAFNGGPTRTRAPQPASLVIDRGSNPLDLTTDQRGAGFARVQKAAPDMGAYEGAGAFLPSVGFLPPAKYPATNAFLRVAIDLNGDGFTDLASVNTAGATADVLINNGDGTFTSRSYAVGNQPALIVACDINGDNKRDLITVNTGSNSLSILANQGDGTFAPASTIATGSNPSWLTCQANISSLLRHNLNVVNSGDGTFMQFQDDGAGNFTLKATVPIGTDPRLISTTDLDFDNLRDSVTFNFASNSVSVLKQGANFAYTRTDYPVQAGPVFGGLTDFDGDGFLDVVTVNATANSVSILINNGAATFKSAVHYPVGTNPRAHSTGDFNRDGSIDIAVRNVVSNDIAILLNRGDGTFAPAVFYPVGGSPISINTTDFDADGVLDLVVAVSSLNGVAVLYGNGNGTFRPALIIPAGVDPSSTVQVADLNGDGRPDIAVPLLGENKIAVLLNTTEFRLGPVARANYQGQWSKAPAGDEAGWTVSFAHQGDTIVATWATYDADRKPLWLTAVLTRTATNVYSGNIATATGPSYEVLPFDPSKVGPSLVGEMTVTFFGSDNAYFAYTVNGIAQAKTITRQLSAGPAPTCSWGAQTNLALATNFQDTWGSATELGWNIALAHQGDTIEATWFTFGADTKPVWFSFVAQKTATNVYAGPLTTSTGPPLSAVPWTPAAVATVVGSATLTFADGNRAVFTSTVNGTTQNRNITRLVFAPPGTLCF